MKKTTIRNIPIKTPWEFLYHVFTHDFKKVLIILIVLAACIAGISIGFSINSEYVSIEKKPLDIEQHIKK